MSHTAPDSPFNEPRVRQASLDLVTFVEAHPRLLVLTGAGVSTDSGIPDYRDDKGDWKRRPPVQHQAFMEDASVRQRYWARSLLGWPVIRNARPNGAHHALAELERLGGISQLVTQNVDRLHQRAGSARVIDLHGRADRVLCMECGYYCTRDEVHDRCAEMNPQFLALSAAPAPDGDADLERHTSDFRIADCPACGGVLKPDVVFFGDFVPGERVSGALETLRNSDGLLVIGSSLMVYSGFRFCRYAREWGLPLATLTLGLTRADHLATLSLKAPIRPTLSLALDRLTP
ncbi:MAG: NAD-dependent protein deacetylase [Marinobacter sp.]|uniref:NAD-dependent protein deacetylase n=1 Tax=Marinobacter sp. TaxID=50741 RepID=UPI00299E5AA7|nr:NAD-dependent protein deacetylase [Marinobacter sp.]MDX1755414.1 NAD-dependent protein deacetylase [Marinobacter sp.]